MKILIKLLQIFPAIGLFIYSIAAFAGRLRFGREMGDIGYVSILFSGILLLSILYFLQHKGIWKKHIYFLGFFAWVLLLFIFWYSSFGRGPDYPWDGHFFLSFFL